MSTLFTILLGLAFATDPAIGSTEVGGAGPSGSHPTTEEPWWVGFGDPALQTLVHEGIEANTDLSVAAARLQQAEGAFWATRSALMPTLSFDVITEHQPINRGSFVPPEAGDSLTQNIMQLGVRGSYEIDLFGRNVLQTRASHFETLASEGDRDAVALVIASRVGEAYYDLATARARHAVLSRQLASNLKLLELVELQREAAAVDTVDVLQQRQQVAMLQAALPSAEAGVELAAFRLAALLGRLDVTDPIATGDLPTTQAQPASESPDNLLERRPDLQAAEARSTAASSRQTAALMAFLPTLQVAGQIGAFSIWWGSQSPSEFNPAYQVSTQLSVPLFAGGRRHGSLKSAKGAQYGASESYRAAEILARQQVEGAFLVDRAAMAGLEAQRAAEGLARSSYERSREQWIEGVSSYLVVFTNLGVWQRAELALLDAEREAVGARIQLHEALGGPWVQGLGEREER